MESFNNINLKKITDWNRFLKTVILDFTNKTVKDEKVILFENNKVISIENENEKLWKCLKTTIKNFHNIWLISFSTTKQGGFPASNNSFRSPKRSTQNWYSLWSFSGNYEILSDIYLNNHILTSLFPEQLKFANVKLAFKKDSEIIKTSAGLSVSLLFSYLK